MKLRDFKLKGKNVSFRATRLQMNSHKRRLAIRNHLMPPFWVFFEDVDLNFKINARATLNYIPAHPAPAMAWTKKPGYWRQ